MNETKIRKIFLDGMLRLIGRDVAVLRRARGWSQLELANRAELGVGTVSRIENGLATSSMTSYYQIAKALETVLWVQFVPLEEIRDEIARGKAEGGGGC